MSWQIIERCVDCKEMLSDHECMYSDGVCPYCGRDSKCTICDTERNSRRKVKVGNGPWYKLWWPIYEWEYHPKGWRK